MNSLFLALKTIMAESTKPDSELKNGEIEESAFEFLGFTPVKAKALCELISANPYMTHQTVAHWARDHIEQQFNILLAGGRNEDRDRTYKCENQVF